MRKVRVSEQHKRLLTRPEGIELIRAELGAPVKKSRFEKDAMTGLAPKAAAYYGRVPLYTPDAILAYGRSLMSPNPRRLHGSRSGLPDERADRGTTTTTKIRRG